MLDAGPIIKLFELGLWDVFIERCTVTIARTVADEAKWASQEFEDIPIDLMPYEDQQRIKIIDIELNLTTVDNYYMNMMSRNLTLFLLGWIPATGDGGEVFDYLLRTVDKKEGFGSYNLGYYSNSDVDRISEEIARTINPEDRLDLMQEGFKIAMSEIVCVPLYVSVCNMGVADCVEWHPRSDMEIRIEEITVKTKN